MSCCIPWMGCGCGEPSGPKPTITNYKRRACTDLPCLALIIAVIVAIAASCWHPAFAKGKHKFNVPSRLVFPHDFKGQRCGQGAFRDQPVPYWPYVNFTGIHNIRRHHTLKLCAESCDVTNDQTRMISTPYKSKQYGGYCLPKVLSNTAGNQERYKKTKANFKKFKSATSTALKDIAAAKWIIMGSVGIALIMSFVYIFLMKIFISPLVYCSIVCIIAALGAIAFQLFQHSQQLPQQRNAVLYISYAIAIIDALFFIVICCLRRRIKMAVEIIKSSSRVMEDVKCISFFPILPFVAEIVFLIAWIYIAMYLFATSETTEKVMPPLMANKILPGYARFDDNYTKLDYSKTAKTKFLPHLFLLFWITAIIHYFTYVIISGVVADWYFTPRDKNGKKLRHNKYESGYNDEIHLTSTPIRDAMRRTIRYHLGTIVFAALIIATIRFIRYLVLKLIKMMDGVVQCFKRPNKIQKCLEGVVQCLLKLLDCILNKVNKNALIYNAIYGDAFCPSVCGSASLIWSNLVRAAFISMISKIVTVLGTIMITMVTVFLCTMIISAEPYDDPKEMHSPIISLLIIGFISFVIAKLFLAVYDTAIDTVFMCFLVDEKQNKSNGSMLADKGLKNTISKYEDRAKRIAENDAEFRQKRQIMKHNTNTAEI